MEASLVLYSWCLHLPSSTVTSQVVFREVQTSAPQDPFEEIKKLTKGKMPSALPASMEAL